MSCHYLESFLEVIYAAKDFRMNHSLLEDQRDNPRVIEWLKKSRMNLEIACAQYVVERDMIVRP